MFTLYISHFKHLTYTLLEYSRDFCNSMKESLKRATKWSAYYFTNADSYYRVSQTKVRCRSRTRIPCTRDPASTAKPSGSSPFVRTTPNMQQELFLSICIGESYLLTTESLRNPVQLMTSCQGMTLTPATIRTVAPMKKTQSRVFL